MGCWAKVRVATVAIAVTVGCGWFIHPASARTDSGAVTFEATIDGQSVADADRNNPLDLRPGDTPIVVKATNGTNQPIEIRYANLDGAVGVLKFFAYSTRIDLSLPPGQSGEVQYVLDLSDLRDQGVGLLPSRFALVDTDRKVVAADQFVADVHGRLASVYGLFGLAVIGVTIVLLAGALYRLFTHRLPPNRWRRGVYFAIPGMGVGLVLTFGLSVFRVFSPDGAVWLTLVIIGGVIGFVIGYLTPAPFDEERDDEALDESEALLSG